MTPRRYQCEDEDEDDGRNSHRDEWESGDPTEPDLIYFEEFTKKVSRLLNQTTVRYSDLDDLKSS